MTAPNPRYEELDIMVTRRVHNREYRLRPSKETNAIVEFVVAILVVHYGLELNAFNTMSTHYHARFFDPYGRASDFCRDAHSMIARLIIWTYGEDDESLWAPVSSNILEDDDVPEGAIDQIAYIACQGVAAGAVKNAKSWPGAKGWWPMRDKVVKRPKGFFQEDTWHPGKLTFADNPAIHWAETATLKFTRPRGYEQYDDNELAVMIDQAIKRREAAARAKFKNVPDAFPGRRAALRTSRRKRAIKPEAKRGAKRVPLIRCSDPERRAERLSGLREWRQNYRKCRLEFRTNREVLFPTGTNKMKVDLDVNVDGADAVDGLAGVAGVARVDRPPT